MKNITLYISAILAFTLFDIVGYFFVLTKGETIEPKKIYLILYRVLQGAFQFAISYFLFIYDLRFAIAFMLSWWFGLYDLLYYLLRGYIPKFDDMFWLRWTPYGFILWLLKKPIGYKYLWFFSAVIFVISIFIIL